MALLKAGLFAFFCALAGLFGWGDDDTAQGTRSTCLKEGPAAHQ